MLHSVYLSARLSLPVTLVTFELTIFCYFLLFFTPLLLLNYFLFNLFFSCKKVGGLKPPQPLPLRGPCCQAIFCQLGPLTTCLAQLYLFARHSYSLKSIKKTFFHLQKYSRISLVDNTPLKIKYSYLQYFFLQKIRTYVTLKKYPVTIFL